MCSRDRHWALPGWHGVVIHLMWLANFTVNKNHTDGLRQKNTRCILIKTIAQLRIEGHAEFTSRYPGVSDPVQELEHS